MVSEQVSALMWAIQLSGVPLFLRKSGKFGDLGGARLYQTEADAQLSINYHGLDYCNAIPVEVSCQVDLTESRDRVLEVIKRLDGRLGRSRDSTARIAEA